MKSKTTSKAAITLTSSFDFNVDEAKSIISIRRQLTTQANNSAQESEVKERDDFIDCKWERAEERLKVGGIGWEDSWVGKRPGAPKVR